MPQQPDVIVVGAGVIGLACAWRIARSGRSVVVLDPSPGAGASWTAAGMLAPVTEFGYGEEALLELNLASGRCYPDFVADVERCSGQPVGYERRGTLQVAWDSADLAGLQDVHARHLAYGLPAELLTGRELRRLEPALASGLPGAVHAPGDHQVDNRALHRALLTASTAAGVELLADAVTGIDSAPDRSGASGRGGQVTGVTLARGGRLAADWVVVATGAHTRRLAGLPAGVAEGVRPVKGQTIRLRGTDQSLLSRVVRGSVKGVPVYIVPRASGEIVVGASSEDAGFDIRPRAGAVYELLRDAFALLPGLAEWTWDEVSTGLRPGTPDNGPLIGATSVAGLLIATGHYRNGMLLAPITADAVAAIVAGENPPAELNAFAPERFHPGRRGAADEHRDGPTNMAVVR